MRRVLSAAILLPIVLGAIWFLPPAAVLLMAEMFLVVAFFEYASLVGRIGVRLPKISSGGATCAACAVMGRPGAGLEAILMITVIVIAGMIITSQRRGPEALYDASSALFAPLYLGLPMGALAAIHSDAGPRPLLLVLLTVMISDTAQYYGGRAFGRRALAPTVSPHKTVEGALIGMAVGTLALVLLGQRWLPEAGPISLLVLGPLLLTCGIMGDLFESSLKRSAGLKDTSGLIPGHGGVLDRIDSLLFAAPVYYIFVRYLL